MPDNQTATSRLRFGLARPAGDAPARRLRPSHHLFGERGGVHRFVLGSRATSPAGRRAASSLRSSLWVHSALARWLARTRFGSCLLSALSSGFKRISSSPITGRSMETPSTGLFMTGGTSTRSPCGRAFRRLPRSQQAKIAPVAPFASGMLVAAPGRIGDCLHCSRPSTGTRAQMAGSLGGDVRSFAPGRTSFTSFSTRSIPTSLPKSSTRSASRSTSDFSGLRVFRRPRGCVSNDDGQHPGDADGNGVSQ